MAVAHFSQWFPFGPVRPPSGAIFGGPFPSFAKEVYNRIGFRRLDQRRRFRRATDAKPRTPIDEVLPLLRQTLALHSAAVLQAPPGAGKTTRIPLALLNESWLKDQSILILEPRRLAARAAAARMAWQLGETVGYRIRFESKVSKSTRIEVLTEGILTRRLQSDPSLEGVGLVIFDEFHERHIETDLALALSLDSQRGLREGLKLLVISATLDGATVAAVLGDAPLLTSEGRSFPVTVRYAPRDPRDPGDLPQMAQQAVLQALASHRGDLLVFLPGAREIRRTQERLDSVLAKGPVDLCPLYGDLPWEAQDRAIRPAEGGRRKVVLATPIAETSLTIEGIGVVIDSGFARVSQFDPATVLTRLTTMRISRASAEQRAGRAGRRANISGCSEPRRQKPAGISKKPDSSWRSLIPTGSRCNARRVISAISSPPAAAPACRNRRKRCAGPPWWLRVSMQAKRKG